MTFLMEAFNISEMLFFFTLITLIVSFSFYVIMFLNLICNVVILLEPTVLLKTSHLCWIEIIVLMYDDSVMFWLVCENEVCH